MSGGGGGGNWPQDAYEIACDQLKFSTQINSPQSPAIGTVEVGDVLTVEIKPLGGTQAVAVVKNGVVVGGLIGGKVNRLRECLIKGSEFKATVLAVNGPQVQIDVEHV